MELLEYRILDKDRAGSNTVEIEYAKFKVPSLHPMGIDSSLPISAIQGERLQQHLCKSLYPTECQAFAGISIPHMPIERCICNVALLQHTFQLISRALPPFQYF